jgi:FAD:protein FMN transferase
MDRRTCCGTGSDGSAQREFSALGTTAFVATTSPEAIDAAEEVLRDELRALDHACSRFRPGSEISRAHLAGGYPVVISPLLADVIGVALDVAAMTGGAVDPTVGSSMVALGYDRDFDAIPATSGSVPARPRPARGWKCIELDTENRLLRVPAGVLVDLGATAKAFAADRSAAVIAEATGSGVLVNLGGDISVAGPSPADGWPIGLALECTTSPRDTEVVVAIRSGGLASSGTGVRTWRRSGRRVHHIVNPKTGDSAVTCWQLVSAAAPTCVAANAASTAAIVWSDEAPARLSHMGFPCRLVGNDGSVMTLGGWPADTHRPDHRHGRVA